MKNNIVWRVVFCLVLMTLILMNAGCGSEKSRDSVGDGSDAEKELVEDAHKSKKRIIYLADMMSGNEFEIEDTYQHVLEQKPTYLRYDINSHGKGKSIYHHTLGVADNTLTFKKIYIEPFSKLKFSIGVFTDGKPAFASDGVGFKVTLLDESRPIILFDQQLRKFDAWVDVSVDLSEYAGKEVRLSLKTDYLKDAAYDWAIWGSPCIAFHKPGKDYEKIGIQTATRHESLIDYYNQVVFSNNGEIRVDRGWHVNAVKTDILLPDMKPENRIRYEIIVLDKSDRVNEKVEIELLGSDNHAMETMRHDVTHIKQTIGGEFRVSPANGTPDRIRVTVDQPNPSILFIKEPIRYCLRNSDFVEKKDNIILISLDTLRADRLSCYGYPKDVSPNIDAVAAESYVFANAFSNSNWTLPAHTSMFTSLYPSQHKISFKSAPTQTYNFYSSQWSYHYFTESLKQQDYLTLAFTGGGYVNSRYGFNKGFDYHVEEVKELNEQSLQILTHLLETNKDKPLFLFFHTYEIHDYVMEKPVYFRYVKKPFHPYGGIKLVDVLDFRDAPGLEMSRYNTLKNSLMPNDGVQYVRDLYDGALAYTDELLGQFFHGLKQMGLYDNSWIIITSDHGEGLGERHNNNVTVSFRHGPQLYDNQIKVPLIIKPPKRKSEGQPPQRLDAFVQLIDLPATILSLVGAEPPPQYSGKNLMPLLTGARKDPGATLYASNINNKLFSVIKDGYKLIMRPVSHHLVHENTYRFQLYNLDVDKQENLNLLEKKDASKYFPVYNELKKDLSKHLGHLFSDGRATSPIESEDNTIQSVDPKKLQRLKELGYL